MRKSIKKSISLFLVAVMLVVGLPVVGLTFEARAADNNSFSEGYYTYEVENGKATITGCDKSISGDVTIPKKLGGYPVTRIGYGAFENCTELTSITISDSMIIISEAAFWGCTRLTSVTIPTSVTSIGGHAFYGCTGLKSITIPDSITSIGYSAFDDTAWYDAQPNGNVYLAKFYYGYKGIMPNNTSVKIKSGTKGIADYAFSMCTGLTSISIPDSVTSIGYCAFYGCEGLTSVTIPDSVTRIDYAAFRDCTGLTSVTIPNSVTNIRDSVFEACSKLVSIKIPNSVTSIGSYAFAYCTGLTNITIPDSVTSIGGCAFRGCTGLTNITIPDSVSSIGGPISVSSIGGPVFDDTAWYNLQPNGDVYVGKVYYKYKGEMPSDTSITIKTGTKGIAGSAFYCCTGLTSIIIPDSVSSIDNYAFNGCTELTSVTIPDSVTSIGESTFENCTGLTSIIIPDSVTSIGDYAFRGCTGLTIITIPDSVTDIGYKAFGYYYNEEDYEHYRIDGFVVKGFRNTAAEIYANENGFQFVALDEEHTHTFSAWTVTTEATCTAEGVETRKCSVCKAEETRKIAKKDHDISHVEEKSTCVVAGVSYDICGECGETFNYTVLPLADHTFSAWTVTTEATCTAEGVETRKCSVCGAEETRKIAKKDHDISHVEEKSTCVVAGVSYDVCGECGETFNYTVLPLADHAFSAWTVTKEPTVFEVGEKQRSCTVCGFTEKSEIEKLRAIEKKDDKTGVSVICSDKSYDGDVEISVTEIFDGTSYHILNTEKGNFQKQLFDIATMVDGKKVQPNGSVFVKIPLPAKYNAQKTVVYYITNDGQLEKIESKVEDGYIIFETTHFSFYAIVDEKTPDTKNCSCKCHKTGFLKFIFKIQLLFQKLFKLNKVCKCGIEHY